MVDTASDCDMEQQKTETPALCPLGKVSPMLGDELGKQAQRFQVFDDVG